MPPSNSPSAAKTSPELSQALRSFSAGRLDETYAACDAILEGRPDHPGALHLLGIIAHASGDTSRARDLLRRAAESPETTADCLLSYAELCLKVTDLQSAVEAARRAVGLDPSLPLGWWSLGDLLRGLRRFEESCGCFERALELNPHFWQARESLARVLQDLGRYEDGLAQAEQAAALHPGSIDIQLRAADIEFHLGRYHAALSRLASTGEAGRGNIDLLTLEAHLLRLIDRSEEAVTVCRDAVAAGFESSELLRAYGLALHVAGRDGDALTMFDRAAANSPLALSDKGVLLSQAGRTAEACEAFGQALAREPALADAWYNRTSAKRYAPGDPDIDAMEQLLAGGCTARDRLLLHFALGKAHMDTGEVEQAFLHWNAGNRMKRAVVDYDADAAACMMASIAERPPDGETSPGPEALSRRSQPSRAESSRDGSSRLTASQFSELPVFVVGMPRSGSSLIEQILASHPQVHGAGELLQLRALFEAAIPGSDAALADAVLDRLRRVSTSAERIVDKDLANFLHLDLIHRVFPRARIIHCRRDPLDTCFSAYTKLFAGNLAFTYDLQELGGYYRNYHALMAHWRRVLPGEVFIDVDYEILVGEPMPQTRRLLDFLGLPWNDACSRFFETERSVLTASSAQVRRPIYRSSVGRAFSLRSQLQPLLEALGDLAPGGLPPAGSAQSGRG